jgi:hypothetical protein
MEILLSYGWLIDFWVSALSVELEAEKVMALIGPIAID